LVIAPILGAGHADAGMAGKGSCCAKTEMHAGANSKCGDMSGMTKKNALQCAKKKDVLKKKLQNVWLILIKRKISKNRLF
jgi:hypothetical protein